jgi:hypothetical protein
MKFIRTLLVPSLLISVAFSSSVQAGFRSTSGSSESYFAGSKHSTTTLESNKHTSSTDHNSSKSEKSDWITETVPLPGGGDKHIETEIYVTAESNGVSNSNETENIWFTETSALHGFQKSSEHYSGIDY